MTPIEKEHKSLTKEIELLNIRIEVAYKQYAQQAGPKALSLHDYYVSLRDKPFSELTETEFTTVCMFGYAMWLDTLNDSVEEDRDASSKAHRN